MKDVIREFDHAVGSRVASLPTWVRPIMLLFTWLGEPVVTVGISATVLGYGLALNKSFFITAGTIAIVTILVGGLLKLFLRRARPVNEYVAKMFFKTFSFPSGHATGALVSFGLAALVISLKWPTLTLTVWIVAVIATLLVSLSRIYLGAHYASDILGGWAVGALGLIALFLIEQ